MVLRPVDREGDIVEGGVYAATAGYGATSGFQLQRNATTDIPLSAINGRSGRHATRIVRPGRCRRIGGSRSDKITAAFIQSGAIQEYHFDKDHTTGPGQGTIQIEGNIDRVTGHNRASSQSNLAD